MQYLLPLGGARTILHSKLLMNPVELPGIPGKMNGKASHKQHAFYQVTGLKTKNCRNMQAEITMGMISIMNYKLSLSKNLYSYSELINQTAKS